MVSVEGLADGPLDDVEVMLRGWLSSEAFDRLLARAPRLDWVHSATSGVERALTPAVARAGPGRDQRPRRLQPPDRRVRADDDPGGQPPAAAAPRAAARADVAAARGRRAARRHRRDRRAGLDRAGRGARWRPRFGCRVVAVRRRPRSPARAREPRTSPDEGVPASAELRAAIGSAARRRCPSCWPSPTSSSWPRR